MDDAYAENVQIADMNALNAVLAVIKWKKRMGVYADLERELHCVYSIRRQRPRQHRSGLMGTDRLLSIRPEFVDVVPDVDLMADDVLYVSMPYATAIHKCACGCGQQAVTPLSPEEWSMTYNGEAISLRPSIGNWGMACKSHYWIRDSRVVWTMDEQRNVL